MKCQAIAFEYCSSSKNTIIDMSMYGRTKLLEDAFKMRTKIEDMKTNSTGMTYNEQLAVVHGKLNVNAVFIFKTLQE